MSDKKLTVVVDGGGSGCRLGAFDNQGILVATAVNGPANLSLGEEQAWLHISRGLVTLAEQLGKPLNWLPSELCLGLAGSLNTDRRTRFLKLVPKEITPTLVTDGHAQLLGAIGGKPGACLAVGTGSVLHWLNEAGEIKMAGGWGFPMGDEGSGAWLGFQLINRYLWHRDQCQSDSEVSVVFKALEDRIGTTLTDVQAWSTNTRSTELASLAPIIVSAAEHGDKLANTILDEGTNQCERLLRIAPTALPVYIVGGLAKTYHARMSASIKERISATHGDAFSGLYSLSQAHQRSAT